MKDFIDNKKFWKAIKPSRSDKISSSNTIILLEKDTAVTNNSRITKKRKRYFTNLVKSLEISNSEKS